MALNVKNAVVEALAAEVAEMAGETKTEAIRRALEERRERLALRVVRQDRTARVVQFLEREVWSQVPPELLGQRMTRAQEDEILGYGPEGV
jgi:antitoxin VapB